MPSIQILNTGRLDERESAFPQAVQLPNGDILCSFGVGGAVFVVSARLIGELQSPSSLIDWPVTRRDQNVGRHVDS